MSLYNAVFKTQPAALIILKALGAEPEKVPRIRDAWVTKDGDEFRLVIFTRTGGGNRQDYEEGNAYLRSLPGFVSDRDDEFDATFAKWSYLPPESLPEATLGLILSMQDPDVEDHQKRMAKALNTILG